ncbi:MAG: hypothetical protein H7146_14750 [Burkholderiaceae bacterium]|nr:hypothetical protein [Microbacteriaceae bacterium]
MPDASNFDSYFTAAIIGFVVVLAVIIVIIVLNVVRVRKSGHNPLTLQSDIATRLVDSYLLSPRASILAGTDPRS